ncbi:MAG: bestrophin family ion channel, partial [Acinetobacter sp.]|nr:bestrophin family ion channel [Acinetobacter sp.]
MIIRDKSNLFRLLFAWHGTILRQILPAIIIVMLLSGAIALVLHYHFLSHIPKVPAIGFTIFGVILSLFVGFRNNACYDRWWEGRKLWGALIANMRHLDRETVVLNPQRRVWMLRKAILFAHLLRDRLRYQTAHPTEFLAFDHLAESEMSELNQQINAPQYVLRAMQKELAQALYEQEISDILYRNISVHLVELGNVQAGCDRIA